MIFALKNAIGSGAWQGMAGHHSAWLISSMRCWNL